MFITQLTKYDWYRIYKYLWKEHLVPTTKGKRTFIRLCTIFYQLVALYMILDSLSYIPIDPYFTIFYIIIFILLGSVLSPLQENNQPQSQFNQLNIGALDSIAALLYSSFFIDALLHANQVVLTNNVTELIENFNQGNLDVIFMDEYFKNELTTNFEKYFLQAEPYYVVFSQNNTHLSKIKSPCLSAQELQKFNLLLYPDYCPIHIRIKQIFKQYQLSLPTIREANYNESTISLVTQSDLVTILPRSLALNKLENPTLHLAAKELALPDLRRTAIFSNGKIPLDVIVNKL